MAGISVYMGLPKHGKTYEVVENVIAENLRIGRRVVSNIAGLDVEEFREYCGNPPKFGELVCITHDEVVKPNFFPVENHPEIESFVKPGDVIALDEVWRWYQTGAKLPENHMNFFRLHGHYTHPETGYTCDIVLITQDIGDLQRKIRMVVSKVFVAQKHIGLGFSNRYLLSIYEGNKLTKTARTASYQRKYSKEVFALYLSHSQKKGAQPVERDADSRGSIWKSPFFMFVLPGAVVLLAYSLFSVYRMFHPAGVAEVSPSVKASSTQSSPVASPAVGNHVAVPESSPVVYSQQWRIVGSYARGITVVWVLSDGRRLRRLAAPSSVTWTADGVEIKLPEGDIASVFSGGQGGQKSFGLSR